MAEELVAALALTLDTVIALAATTARGIPYYSGSFAASGEFQRTNFEVNGISYGSELSVFEEVYDSLEKRAAFRVTKNGDVMTYILDFRTKRNYLIRTYVDRIGSLGEERRDGEIEGITARRLRLAAPPVTAASAALRLGTRRKPEHPIAIYDGDEVRLV
ncbi:hypothetical protein HPB50_021027 [Hyalomma asiaticum]|uniref:Uncharacterized protein n=1 Tax=Hyalomma asiaticum TaxID=266040 RepID=A0ACB7S875_HYAAI|nr:hypothetical protein HPB50_021027 [Hyalomma asiaticum]